VPVLSMNLGTVTALGLIFAPFNYKTIVFIAVTASILAIFPIVTSFLTKVYGNKTAAIRVKWVVFVLFGLGALCALVGERGGVAGIYCRYASCGICVQRTPLGKETADFNRGFFLPRFILSGQDRLCLSRR